MTEQTKPAVAFKPKRPEGYLRVTCPDCGHQMRTIYTKQQSPTVQERRVVCRNDACMALYNAQVVLYQQINAPLTEKRLAELEAAK